MLSVKKNQKKVGNKQRSYTHSKHLIDRRDKVNAHIKHVMDGRKKVNNHLPLLGPPKVD